MKRRRKFVAGRDRVGGYYGRFAGAGAELKFFDTLFAVSPVANDGTSLQPSMNLIPQGVTESTRNGRKCTLKSINMKLSVSLGEKDAVADPAASDSIRIIFYLDKQCNGATAVVSDILETSLLRGFRNLSNQNRFVILSDKYHNINYQTLASDTVGVVSSASVIRTTTWYRKLNIPLEFSATTGAITELRSNNIGILLISSNAAGVVSMNVRVRFSDF